jgi:hypothetical protein
MPPPTGAMNNAEYDRAPAPIGQQTKNAPLCVAEVQAKYDEKRRIHFRKASPPFPRGDDNDRINAQEQIELGKCQECPTMWMVADKSQETGIPGTHIGSGTVTCMRGAEWEARVAADNAAAASAIDDAVLSPMQKCIDDMSQNEPGRDATEYCAKVK